MTRTLRWLAVLAIPLLIVVFAPLPYSMSAADATLCDKTPAPANLNFSLKDTEGRTFTLSSLKGKVILLDFWATWCAPCKVEIPWFTEFQTKYGPKGLSVIGVSVDDPIDKLKPFVRTYKMNYPVLLGEGRDDLLGPKGFGTTGVFPTTFVIGRDARICKAHLGLSAKEKFEQEIKALL
jgi:cytochrome c biogenesis protein CcmG/thiol:disulfide interchange protein DsbE